MPTPEVVTVAESSYLPSSPQWRSGSIYLIHRKFPNFFPGMVGLLVWIFIGGGITAIFEYFGWVPREYFGVATVVVTFALVAIPVFISWWRMKRRGEGRV